MSNLQQRPCTADILAADSAHEQIVLSALSEMPLYAFEVASGAGKSIEDIANAMERCLAANWAYISHDGARPEVTQSGQVQLHRPDN